MSGRRKSWCTMLEGQRLGELHLLLLSLPFQFCLLCGMFRVYALFIFYKIIFVHDALFSS